jgi:hypothetical protein
MLTLDLIISVLVIISGIITGWYIYHGTVRDILVDQCVLETSTCVNLSYMSYENSVVFTVEPYGYTCWYDGDSVYVYDAIANTETCPMTQMEDGTTKNFVSAYKLQKTPFIFSSSSTNQTVCIESIDEIKAYYTGMGAIEKKLHKRVPGMESDKDKAYNIYGSKQSNSTFSVYDAVNLLVNEKIIKI